MAAPKFDACALITKEEIEAIEGSPMTDVKSSENSDGEFRVSQCFYTAKEYARSVSLAVTQSNPDKPGNRTPRDFWKETFGRFSGGDAESEKEKKASPEPEREKGEKEKSAPPKKIAGLGDEAYWIGNRMGGTLYVLKKDAFIRVAVGNADSPETMLNKAKALAEKAIAAGSISEARSHISEAERLKASQPNLARLHQLADLSRSAGAGRANCDLPLQTRVPGQRHQHRRAVGTLAVLRPAHSQRIGARMLVYQYGRGGPRFFHDRGDGEGGALRT